MATSQLAFLTLMIILFLLISGSSSSTDARKGTAGDQYRRGIETRPQVYQISSYVEKYRGKYASSIESEPKISNYGNSVESGKFMRDIQSQPQISSYDDK